MIEIVIEPKTNADQQKLGQALGKLTFEDPSFRVTANEETGQTLIGTCAIRRSCPSHSMS